MIDSIIEGVVETLGGDWAGGANALGCLDADAVTREEGGRGEFLALAVVHPGGGGFHARERTDGG